MSWGTSGRFEKTFKRISTGFGRFLGWSERAQNKPKWHLPYVVVDNVVIGVAAFAVVATISNHSGEAFPGAYLSSLSMSDTNLLKAIRHYPIHMGSAVAQPFLASFLRSLEP